MGVTDDDREVLAFYRDLDEVLERIQKRSTDLAIPAGPLAALLEEFRGLRKELVEIRSLLERMAAK